ncbi:MAG TPA: hypothetical protein VNH42_08375 [Mariprofundaceae bacterium]|nr:hypothetical protein [Mariprofundaceae bacterium]
METPGERLFQTVPGQRPTEIYLGEYPCDIPFGGGEIEKVAVSLTTDSPHAQHGIPVLRLHAGHQMDFSAFEQTPVGHAAKIVADWLEAHEPNVSDPVRYAAELFLWQWPGIRQTADGGHWRLVDHDERQRRFAGALYDCEGNLVVHEATRSELPMDAILDCGNLQVAPYGFCNKGSPCFLLDACLLCPHFLTNRHFLANLERRIPELQQRRGDAAAANNRKLAEHLHLALEHIESIIMAIRPMDAI